MSLLGSAAMLLSFDVAPEAVTEHDAWHTHEHLPERLSIPGFRRGTRWVALSGQPRYCVIYEVATLAVLTSPAYLERLNDPSPWTRKMMPFYRGMSRGLCAVTGSFGGGIGHAALLVRLTPPPEDATRLRRWLIEHALPGLPARPGIGSAHLLERAATPPMTREQRIRGADASPDWALVVTGYDEAALAALADSGLDGTTLGRQGAVAVERALYRLDYSLTDREVGS